MIDELTVDNEGASKPSRNRIAPNMNFVPSVPPTLLRSGVSVADIVSKLRQPAHIETTSVHWILPHCVISVTALAPLPGVELLFTSPLVGPKAILVGGPASPACPISIEYVPAVEYVCDTAAFPELNPVSVFPSPQFILKFVPVTKGILNSKLALVVEVVTLTSNLRGVIGGTYKPPSVIVQPASTKAYLPLIASDLSTLYISPLLHIAWSVVIPVPVKTILKTLEYWPVVTLYAISPTCTPAVTKGEFP